MLNVWKNMKEVNKFFKDENPKDNRILTKNVQISLNHRLPNNNMALITPDYSRRNNTIIFQNLQQMGSSYVVVDTQGELFRICAQTLAENGYTVKVLDLINLDDSMSYSPFLFMKGEIDVETYADGFAKCFVSKYKGRFADPSLPDVACLYSKILFFSAWYWAKEKQRTACMKDVAELAHMEREWDENIETGEPITKLSRFMKKWEEEKKYYSCTSSYNKLKQFAPEITAEISALFYNMLYECGAINENSIFSKNDINIEELGTGIDGDLNKKMVVFLKVPNVNTMYNWIGSLFLTQCSDVLMNLSYKHKGKCPVRVEFFLNDMACGCVPIKLERILSLTYRTNISYVLTFNGIEQLQAMYPDEEWKIIMDNLSIVVYTGVSKDKDTHRYISSLCGYTVNRKKTLFHHSTYKEELSVSLDDIQRMPHRAALILVRGYIPIYDKHAYDLSMMYDVKVE